MKIGELARRTGVSRDTIRFYERQGLLPKPLRTPSGYRDFPDAAADDLTFIRKAKALGLRPRARFHAFALAGTDPVTMLKGPIPATHKILAKTGLSIGDIDLFEVNEAFASVVLAWQKETGADMNRVNVNGGAIALGHPLGASGSKLMSTLLCELERTEGRYGLQLMCEGGGLANATIIERI